MSLRHVVVAVLAVGVIVSSVVGLTHPPALWLILACYWTFGIIVIAVECGRYRPVLRGTNFQPTAERYQDPVSGQTIRVYADPATGQRDYRPAPDER